MTLQFILGYFNIIYALPATEKNYVELLSYIAFMKN
jgi:hypothetical protein